MTKRRRYRNPWKSTWQFTLLVVAIALVAFILLELRP